MKHIIKVLLLSICLTIGCNKDDAFPDVYINESIYVTGPEYIGVYNNLWAYQMEPGGVGGLIIVQGMNSEFIVYDQACTFEASQECVISGENNNNDIILACKNCCNSKFVINDGSVIEGPANRALKRYNSYFDGTILHITN